MKPLASVKFSFESPEIICGFLPTSFRKLFRLLQEHSQQWLQMTCLNENEQVETRLVLFGDNFQYRFNLNPFRLLMPIFNPFPNSKVIDITKDLKIHVETLNHNAVHCVIVDKEITTENNTMQLTTTNNYFADLATAVEANLFTRDGKNPKKADLYLAIDAYNDQLVKAPEVTIDVKAVEVQAVPTVQALPTPPTLPMLQSTEAYDTLRSQWAENKTAKSTRTKVRAATATATVKDCTYTAKATKSNPSKKIVELIEMLTVGTTKEAICQAFQWKSWNPKTSVVLNYGYNLQMEDGIYSIAK